MKRFRFKALVAAALILSAGAAGPPAAVGPLQKIRLSINPHFVSYLAAFVAIDKGYFRDAGIDLEITKYNGGANTQMAIIAHGDLDITGVVPGPPLFNQVSQGFNLKLVSSISEAHPGFTSAAMLMVRKDVWDSGAIRKLSDLRGKKIDGSATGSPCDLLAKSAVLEAGLKFTDVQYTAKLSSPTEQLAGLRNGAAEVDCTAEPTASEMVAQGFAHKWLYYGDVIPWFQETYWGVNGDFLTSHRDAVQKFLTAYLRGVADVTRAKGQWTPEMVGTMSHWSELSPDIVKNSGTLPYLEPAGKINFGSLKRLQTFWHDQGLVPVTIEVEKLADVGVASDALRNLPK